AARSLTGPAVPPAGRRRVFSAALPAGQSAAEGVEESARRRCPARPAGQGPCPRVGGRCGGLGVPAGEGGRVDLGMELHADHAAEAEGLLAVAVAVGGRGGAWGRRGRGGGSKVPPCHRKPVAGARASPAENAPTPGSARAWGVSSTGTQPTS